MEENSEKRILIVDDDEFILDLLQKVLKKAGYLTKAVDSGAEAIITMLDGDYDLFIFDLNMEIIDGFQLSYKVRKSTKYRETPILMLTGDRSKESVERGQSMGINAWATKPISKLVLLDAVKKLL